MKKILPILSAITLTCGALVSAQEEREIAAGPEYSAGGFHNFWFGSGYRDLWTATIKVPVLDLATAGGGLSPVRQVGQAQSVGLALKGGDGRAYTFRLLKKEPERMMPEIWRKSWPAKIARDQTSGTHPGAGLILPKLGEAAGVAWVTPRLAIMPDDPALGEFRETFANQLGTLAEFPLPIGGGNPGFMGATEILSTSNLWKKWLEGPENRVDSEALLRARILDLWVDNFDRHRGQWRWMRIPGQPLLQPLPEDPDMVLVHHDGQLMNSLRNTIPRLLNFSSHYSKRLEGPLINSFEVDRWLLSDLERSDWEAAAKDLQARFTDEVIDQALRDLPREWYDLNGAWAVGALKERRDHLVNYVLRVYDYYAKVVDIHATDRPERVAVVRSNDDLDVAITVVGESEPWYQRRFKAAETDEVRVYLHGGDDTVERTGPAGGPIKLRVIADGGSNTVDDSASGGTEIWRDGGTVTVKAGPGTHERTNAWTNPSPVEGAPWIEPRSFGHWTTRAPILAWHADIRLLAGYRFQRTAWGFRTEPARSIQTFGAAFAPTDRNGKVEYEGLFRRPMSNSRFEVRAFASAIERFNFFGFGNETPVITDREKYRTRQNVFLVQPTFRFNDQRGFSFFAGPELRYSKAPTNVDSVLDQANPTGSGSYGRLAARAGVTLSSSRLRGTQAVNFADGISDSAAEGTESLTGVKFEGETFLVPKAWDAKTGYQGVDAAAVAYVGNARHHLAFRAGGRKLWGDYAWFDAATMGGQNDRGFRSHRFYGDSSLYGTISGRLMLGDLMGFPVVPLRVGVVGFVDNGRVWLKGETSDTWHTSVGGGLLIQPVGIPMTLHGIIAHSKEGNRFSFAFGYPF